MKEIDLPLKNKRVNEDFGPIELSENVKIEGNYDIGNDKYAVEGEVTRNEKKLGRFTYNDVQKRIFVNINTEDLKRNTRIEIISAITSIVTKIVPVEAE